MSEAIARSPAGGCGTEGRLDLPLDKQQLVRRCLGRVELAERLLASFETRFPTELTRIEECLHAADSPDLTRLVHQLKGATANVSALALYGVMSRLEELLRSAERAEAGRCLEEVHREWERYQEFKAASACHSVAATST